MRCLKDVLKKILRFKKKFRNYPGSKLFIKTLFCKVISQSFNPQPNNKIIPDLKIK